jgi:hypothetical protein
MCVCRSWAGAVSRQAIDEKSGPISGDHFGFVRLVSAFPLLDLLGTALLCSLAIFWCYCIGVDNLLSERRFSRYECRSKTYAPNWSHDSIPNFQKKLRLKLDR